MRLLRVVAKIARGFKGHDLKEASLFPNAERRGGALPEMAA